MNSLILKGKNLTFDALLSNYKINDVSFTLLKATFLEMVGDSFDDNRDFISMHLVSDTGFLTNAGLLLCDQGLLLQSKVVCTRWNGITKGNLNEDAIDDKEYKGSIISLLNNADTFIRNNSKSSWVVDGMQRSESVDYPIRARREAIVNALIHRDYQIIGSEIHIDMFDDRMEIVSPGGMVDGSQIQNLEIGKVPSMRRNAIISDVFSRLKYMDRRGSGLNRILESYKDIDSKPIFISDESSFTVIFPNIGYYKKTGDKISISKSGNNIISDRDFFLLKIYKNDKVNVRKKTLENIVRLFDVYGFEKEFSRNDIMSLLELKESRSSEIISDLLELNLIKKIESSNYIFIK